MNPFWEDFVSRLASRGDSIRPLFNPGCTDRDLQEARAVLGLQLPEDYCDFVRTANGQPDNSPLSFPPDQLSFLSLSRVISLWQQFLEHRDDTFIDSFEDGNRVRCILYHPLRIPIAYNEPAGACLMIDFIPGPQGLAGQLIFNANETDFVVLASNLSGLCKNYLRWLESGDLQIIRQAPAFGTGFHFASRSGLRVDWETFHSLPN